MKYLAKKLSVEPLVSFEEREKYLLVRGYGRRDKFAEMVKASEMIYAKVLETNARYLLVDYSLLEVHLNMSEALNMVRKSETSQPQFKRLVAAMVVGPTGIEFGRFWQHLAVQRGFNVQVFEDFAQAERWLISQ
jgi:hypothetical protein